MQRHELSAVGAQVNNDTWADKNEYGHKVANPGWLLAYGLESQSKKSELIDRAAFASAPSCVYEAAYRRWSETVKDESRFAVWEGQLENRLLIGMGASGPLETNITLSRPYGMPMIPGSALKGAARALADAVVDREVRTIVFGQQGHGEEEFESGYLVFHDAWWIPGSAAHALTPEVTTPHHPAYYQGKSMEATDFDSPIPVPQIAAHGAFLFVIEGVAAWAEFGLAILRDALKDRGIGAAKSAGYGYFIERK